MSTIIQTLDPGVARLETAFENASLLTPTQSPTSAAAIIATSLFTAAVSPVAVPAPNTAAPPTAAAAFGPALSFANFGMAAPELDEEDEAGRCRLTPA